MTVAAAALLAAPLAGLLGGEGGGVVRAAMWGGGIRRGFDRVATDGVLIVGGLRREYWGVVSRANA